MLRRRTIEIGNVLKIHKILERLGTNYKAKNRRERSLLIFSRDAIAYIKIYAYDIEYTYAIRDTPRFVNNPKEVIEDIIDNHMAKYPSKPIKNLLIFTVHGILCLNAFLRLYAFLRIFTHFYAFLRLNANYASYANYANYAELV